jgi:hypothetical protein
MNVLSGPRCGSLVIGSPVVGNPAVDLDDHRPVPAKPYLHEMGGP